MVFTRATSTLGDTIDQNVTYDGDGETVAVVSTGVSVAGLKDRFREVKPFEGSGLSRVGFTAAPLHRSDITGNFACCAGSAGIRASHFQLNLADVAKAAVGKDMMKYLSGTFSKVFTHFLWISTTGRADRSELHSVLYCPLNCNFRNSLVELP